MPTQQRLITGPLEDPLEEALREVYPGVSAAKIQAAFIGGRSSTAWRHLYVYIDEIRIRPGDTVDVNVKWKRADRNDYWHHLTGRRLAIGRIRGAEPFLVENQLDDLYCDRAVPPEYDPVVNEA